MPTKRELKFSRIAKPKKAQRAIKNAKRRGAFDITAIGNLGRIKNYLGKQQNKKIRNLRKLFNK